MNGLMNGQNAHPDDWLQQVLHHLDHLLPAQAPIRDFVHHNTLHGFQHLTFRAAIEAAEEVLGHRGYLPEAEFRRLYRAGRIKDADLLGAMASAAAESPSEFPFATLPLPPGVDRQACWLALLSAPAEPLTRAALRWKIEEEQAPAADDGLWQSCREAARQHLAHSDLLRSSQGDFLRPSDGDSLRSPHGDSLRSQNNSRHATWHTEATHRAEAPPVDASAPPPADETAAGDEATAALFDSIGQTRTWSEVLQVLTGLDLSAEITPPEIRLFAAGLDRGVAAWPLPARRQGLYAAWHSGLRGDPTQSGASNDLGRSALYAELPADPAGAIKLLLDHYAIPEGHRAGYLTRLALSLPGWTGMLRWHENNEAGTANHAPGATARDAATASDDTAAPDHDAAADHRAASTGQANPLHLLDGLAILLASEYHVVSRLIFERWSLRPRIDMLAWYFREHPAEALIRRRLHSSPLPEALAARAARLIASVPNPAEGDGAEWQALANELRRADRDNVARDYEARLAYPLWQVCRQAGIAATTLAADHDYRLIEALLHLDAERRSYVWLLAYEHAYRQQVLAVLAANHRAAPPTGRPSAQLLCCMDEREEGFRRHLEEVAPTVETLGAAGFFGVAMRWRGIDADSDVALCPVVVKPTHRVEEVATDAAAAAQRQARRQRRLGLKRAVFQRGRHHLPSALAGTLAGAPLALAAMIGRLFAPRLSGRAERRLVTRFDGAVSSRLQFTASPAKDGDTAQISGGFSDAEQIDRVGALLRTIGLVERFAPLVVIVGHGSHSLNNPHASAYDCGACGGKHGGPNARLLAAMANRTVVRQGLIERGIFIPPDTLFLAAQHDTCDDTTQWFDSETIAESHRQVFFVLRRQVAEAGRRHALERCRRFASAPDGLSPEAAQRHVAGRGEMPAQARPELGHVTNACAIIGRRSLSRGTFLDRRCFLISYDPRIDADGRILESILLAAGPVGAGISLEYYFSTVNNAGYGCRTKVMHNLAGLVGVMEGTQSDLRTGLPQQMIEIHEAMRLLVLCDAEPATLSAVVARQPALQELVGHGWIRVGALSPSSGRIFLYEPARGWLPWPAEEATGASEVPQLPEVPLAARSIDCFIDAKGRFRRDALTPTLLQPQATAVPR